MKHAPDLAAAFSTEHVVDGLLRGLIDCIEAAVSLPVDEPLARQVNFEAETEALFMKDFKIIVEKHSDGYVAYPLGRTGIVVGEGNTYEEAMADVKSAIAFHLETFADLVPVSDLKAAYRV